MHFNHQFHIKEIGLAQLTKFLIAYAVIESDRKDTQELAQITMFCILDSLNGIRRMNDTKCTQ